MHLLPLQSLLNIPSEGFTIVVDNAISPQESVSFRRMHSLQKKQLCAVPSSGKKQESDRWSATPLPPLVMPEDAIEPCSTDKPMRRTLAPQESDHDLPKEVAVKNKTAAVSTRCSSLTLKKKIPVSQHPRPRSISLNSKMNNVNKSEPSKYMMRSVEAMQPSGPLEVLPVFVDQELQGMSTIELIEKAIGKVSDLSL